VQQQEQEQEQGQEQEQEQGSKQQQQQQQECLLRPPYDIVLCADCVYTPASALPLLETLRQLLGPRSVALAACEMRTGAGLEQLHAALPEAGLVEALVRASVVDAAAQSGLVLQWAPPPALHAL
jgi:Lysine methyltransferase